MPAAFSLKQLAYFVALAETRHYRKAAERMGISQSSLSQQILGLETALGLDLVERGQRGAVLTPQGRGVLDQARKSWTKPRFCKPLRARRRAGGPARSGWVRPPPSALISCLT